MTVSKEVYNNLKLKSEQYKRKITLFVLFNDYDILEVSSDLKYIIKSKKNKEEFCNIMDDIKKRWENNPYKNLKIGFINYNELDKVYEDRAIITELKLCM